MSQTNKVRYEKPTIKKIGDFEAITKGNSTGRFIDFDFDAHTPVANLTFS